MQDKDHEDMLSASVPVSAVVVAPEAMLKVRDMVTLMAYRTAASTQGRMQLSRAFRATIKGFNKAYGQNCRTWGDVLVEVTKMIKAEREASK